MKTSFLSTEAGDGAGIDLYWLPLGAGGRSVRVNGRIYELLAARLAGRLACDLYHSALVVGLPGTRFVIEQGPVTGRDEHSRGVVGEGPVGSPRAGKLRLFRYELRCWRDGWIPDVAEAVDSPRRLSGDALVARRLLELVQAVPMLTWGRDESGAGEMWNSNSVVAWLLARSGLDAASISPPAGGRAPGWAAGVTVARRASPELRASRRTCA